MYGKMQASGLTEFIPFICISPIWGQSHFFVHPASCIATAPQRSPQVVAASAEWISFGSPHSHFLPGNSHGQKSLAGYIGWGRKVSD